MARARPRATNELALLQCGQNLPNAAALRSRSFLRCADGAVETRQPAVAQPAGCCVSNKYGATWGSRGELRCPLERALPLAHVLSDHVHRASCGACVPQQQPAPDLPMAQHVSWLTGRIICRVTTAAGIDGSFDRGEDGAIDSRGLRRAIWRRWRLHVPVAAICRRGLIFGCRGFGLDATGNAPSAKVAVASGASRILGRSCACARSVCVCESLSRDELAPVDPC